MRQQRWVRVFAAFFVGAMSSVSLAGGTGQEISQGFVRITDSGRLEAVERVSKQVCVPAQGTRTVNFPETRMETYQEVVNGQKVVKQRPVTVNIERQETYTYMVCKTVYETTVSSFAPGTNGFLREADKAEIPIYDLSGNRLSINSLQERLRDWTLVLFSKTGKPVDRKLAGIFRPGTIVVGRPAATPVVIPPMMAPAPFQASPPPSASLTSPIRSVTPVSFLAADPATPQLPNAAEPGFAYAKVWGEKQLALRTETEATKAGTFTRTTTVLNEVDGKKVPQLVQMSKQYDRTILTQDTVRFDLDDVQITKTPHRNYEKAELPSALANEVLAVVSRDGREIDPLWLRNIREGVFVVVCPATADSYAAAPMAPMMTAPVQMPAPTASPSPLPAPTVNPAPSPQPVVPTPRPPAGT